MAITVLFLIFLTTIFCVWQKHCFCYTGYRQPFQSSRNKRPKFHPQTFNEIIDTKSLPLSYKWLDSNQQYPNPAILCDYSNCAVTQDTDQFVRLACCHTFHQECYLQNNSNCPICTKPLLKKVAMLADAFNLSLLSPTKSSSSTTNIQLNLWRAWHRINS